MTETTLFIPKDRRELAAERIKRFVLEAMPGKEMEVTFRPKKRERSNQQCRYLNGVAYKLLSDATGYERDDISEYLCGSYWGWKDKPMPGKKTVQVPIRTTTRDADGKRCVLSKLDFADYVAWVQRFAAKQGVLIPDPDPEYWVHQDEPEQEAA